MSFSPADTGREDINTASRLLNEAREAAQQDKPSHERVLELAAQAWQHCGENRRLQAAVLILVGLCLKNLGDYARAWDAYKRAKRLDLRWKSEAEDGMRFCDAKMKEIEEA